MNPKIDTQNCQQCGEPDVYCHCVKTPTHTPTPWKWNNGNLVGPDGEIIAEKNDDGSIDAAFIVLAVNAFDAMKTALEVVKRGHEPYSGYIATMVNQALEKAEGQ